MLTGGIHIVSILFLLNPQFQLGNGEQRIRGLVNANIAHMQSAESEHITLESDNEIFNSNLNAWANKMGNVFEPIGQAFRREDLRYRLGRLLLRRVEKSIRCALAKPIKWNVFIFS